MVHANQRRRYIASVAAPLFLLAPAFAQPVDPLPSWNDGPAKKPIVEFVQATTTQGSSAKFVSPEARIATFDQDGTLWVVGLSPLSC